MAVDPRRFEGAEMNNDRPVEKPTVFGVGMPATLYLEYFGWLVYCVFGDYPYLVGSALRTKQWRDVDVRLMMLDKEYKAWGFGDPTVAHTNGKWVGLTMAFSALGKQLTGLPVDFQIQQTSHANKVYSKQVRSCLGLEHKLVHVTMMEVPNVD